MIEVSYNVMSLNSLRFAVRALMVTGFKLFSPIYMYICTAVSCLCDCHRNNIQDKI